jgi:hypothetical protein
LAQLGGGPVLRESNRVQVQVVRLARAVVGVIDLGPVESLYERTIAKNLSPVDCGPQASVAATEDRVIGPKSVVLVIAG